MKELVIRYFRFCNILHYIYSCGHPLPLNCVQALTADPLLEVQLYCRFTFSTPVPSNADGINARSMLKLACREVSLHDRAMETRSKTSVQQVA